MLSSNNLFKFCVVCNLLKSDLQFIHLILDTLSAYSRTLTLQRRFYLLQGQAFKNDEKYLLFHVKSFFRS